jgi:hypothetical protein
MGPLAGSLLILQNVLELIVHLLTHKPVVLRFDVSYLFSCAKFQHPNFLNIQLDLVNHPARQNIHVRSPYHHVG